MTITYNVNLEGYPLFPILAEDGAGGVNWSRTAGLGLKRRKTFKKFWKKNVNTMI